MNSIIQREVSRNIPQDIPIRFSESTVPLFTAYGCVLMERDTGKSYIYTAVNLKNGRREVICRRSTPLLITGVEAMAERIRLSNVAGAGRLEADIPFGDGVALDNCREILNAIFNEFLPRYGFTVRQEQVSLANHVLDAIQRRNILLAEAEVGTGKTLAYLVPAVIAKRGRLNGYHNLSFYTGSPYVEMAHMPIVIATSSIALQKALVSDYIPELSNILLECGVIKEPLIAVIRKGREHYVCERNLRNHIPFERKLSIKNILEGLLNPYAQIDLAEIDGLTPNVKRKIAVPDRCDRHCPHRSCCAYLLFREQANSAKIDIQVCNHNYLLADTLRRRDNKPPLIPNYQSIVIDEAHKFLQAARTMYGVELSSLSLPEIEDLVLSINFKHEETQKHIRGMAKLLTNESKRLFRKLLESAESVDAAVNVITEDESDRFIAVIDDATRRHIRNIRVISKEIIKRLNDEPVVGNGKGRKSQLLWELERVYNQADMLTRHNELICWVKTEDQETKLCSIPKDLDRRLFDDLWSKGLPTILTSGTLSANGDFSHIKRALGIEQAGNRINETSKPSPFNHRDNSLIYISEKTLFPDQRNQAYILSIAEEIEQLLYASHGHAAVLFTSYKVMDMVWELFEEVDVPFPMFRLDKGGIKEIERFKKSGNGVLFAAGALWEGIDIPGDALSMVIIVKLPFQVPDPISEYEKSLFDGMDEYKEIVIIPAMQIRLKQGAGRLLRIETDTGVIALIDIRAGENKAYHHYALDALPDCQVTNDKAEVENFYRMKKAPEYFN